MSTYPAPAKIVHTPTKSTSIIIRFNNGEITQGIEALRAFCSAVLGQDATPKHDAIADAMLKNWNGGANE
jgi:hypothetical protein